MTSVREPKPAVNLRDLPRDPRGFLVPAEAPWAPEGPVLSKIDPILKFILTAHRACAVCGYPIPAGEPVWRIHDDFSRAKTHEEMNSGRPVTENDTPGHLVCMLYSALVCPFWRTAGGRLGKDSIYEPGGRRGDAPSIMGFADFAILIDPERPISGVGAQPLYFLHADYRDEIVFNDPLVELWPVYEMARVECGGRYVRGKRRHYAPALGGRKRLEKEVEAAVAELNSVEVDGWVPVQGVDMALKGSGWMRSQ